LGAAFLGAAFLGAAFLGAALVADFFAEADLALTGVGFLATALTTDLPAAAFLAGDFLAGDFLAAVTLRTAAAAVRLGPALAVDFCDEGRVAAFLGAGLRAGAVFEPFAVAM
jgi:hypothetical protein